MSQSWNTSLRKAFQRWTLAASFVVGQVGVMPSRPAPEPYPFVRLLPERRDSFAPTEVVRGRRATIVLSEALDVSSTGACSSSLN